MHTKEYNVIGIMSGTSLDGVDLAHITFNVANANWSFKIHDCETISYSLHWIEKLKNAVNFSDSELSALNTDYTTYLAAVITAFINRNSIENIDAVCSHGHTIKHQPENGITLQIGNLPQISTLTNQTVVCDFRVADVELGGQGAPLVPIGDQILFNNYDYCLNLGGFSNISFEGSGNRIAFDISAVNTVLNFYANKLNLDFDDQGKIAATGEVNQILLNQLNALEYYAKLPPKSLGFEYVQTVLLPLIETFKIPIQDKMCTFCDHVAFQISEAIPLKLGKMLITGGGAYHSFLIKRISFHVTPCETDIPNNKLIEYKEALIFAMLGVLKLRNEINVLSSVTGATRNHSSGKVFYPTS